MRPQLEEDRKRRQLVKKHGIKRLRLKSMSKNSNLSDKERSEALRLLRKLPRNSSPTRVKNRCVKTGRSRGVMRMFKLSRVTFRKMAMDGQLPGVKKASWLFIGKKELFLT